ncbi:hypothetical protein EDB86DRAFT_2827648 [Lactarius hatsudake]|nr:hypothetical protein EDB86DRAFT_2827648 [Lactarius hatsudake]
MTVDAHSGQARADERLADELAVEGTGQLGCFTGQSRCRRQNLRSEKVLICELSLVVWEWCNDVEDFGEDETPTDAGSSVNDMDVVPPEDRQEFTTLAAKAAGNDVIRVKPSVFAFPAVSQPIVGLSPSSVTWSCWGKIRREPLVVGKSAAHVLPVLVQPTRSLKCGCRGSDKTGIARQILATECIYFRLDEDETLEGFKVFCN